MTTPRLLRTSAVTLLVLAPCAAGASWGRMLCGRALMTVGFVREGATMSGETGWLGYELAKEGLYQEAVAALGSAPSAAYDRGNALMLSGRYEAAVEAYENALSVDPDDEDARHNESVAKSILALATPRAKGRAGASVVARRTATGSGEGDATSSGPGYVGNEEGGSPDETQGSSRVAKVGLDKGSQGDPSSDRASGSAGQAAGGGRAGADLADVATQLAATQRKVERRFEARLVRPDVEWLQTVEDDPGRFLKLQIRVERKRREAEEARQGGRQSPPDLPTEDRSPPSTLRERPNGWPAARPTGRRPLGTNE